MVLRSSCRRVARQFLKMRDRNVTKIQLRTEKDAIEAELPNAKLANALTIMAASLHADAKHRVSFFPPQERTEEETEMLRRVARHVYMNYTHQAYDGFSLLCDANRHFGTTVRFTVRRSPAAFRQVRMRSEPRA